MKRKQFPMLWLYIVTILGCMTCIVLSDRAITVISEGLPVSRAHCIILDAGHGGEDGGATSCTGKLESSYNLEITLRLRDLLHLMGYKTEMIRTTDTSIYTKGETLAQKKISDLKERVRICNEKENALLLSIHQNHFSDSRYSGAQVFYGSREEGQQLAKILQRELRSVFQPIGKREAKRAEGIYLMEHILIPGVLIECGFLSNPEEEAKLGNETYQKQLCCVISATVSNFLDG